MMMILQVFTGIIALCFGVILFHLHLLTRKSRRVKWLINFCIILGFTLGLIQYFSQARNWSYELINLVPASCPELPPAEHVIHATRTTTKNQIVTFHLADFQVPYDNHTQLEISLEIPPVSGTFSIAPARGLEPLQAHYLPNFDFLGCDRMRIKVQDKSASPTPTRYLDISITYLISPALLRPILTFPGNYRMAELWPHQQEEIKSIFQQAEYSSLFPEIDTWYSQRFPTCAIVGNGGVLKNRGLGPFIDTHDAIFRFNAAPVKGFEQDVGSKTSFMWSCSIQKWNCWTWKQEDDPQEHYQVFAQARSPKEYELFRTCSQMFQEEGRNVTLNAISYQWMNLADAILKDYVADPTLREDKRRSTGMAVFMAAITVCDQVNIFGFGDNPNGIHHYWETEIGDRVGSVHKYDAEQQFFHDVINGKGIYQKYLWAYNPSSKINFVQ